MKGQIARLLIFLLLVDRWYHSSLFFSVLLCVKVFFYHTFITVADY